MAENPNQTQNQNQNPDPKNKNKTNQANQDAGNNNAPQNEPNPPAQQNPLTRFIAGTEVQVGESTINIKVQDTPEFKALQKQLKEALNIQKETLITAVEPSKLYKPEELKEMSVEELSGIKKVLDKQAEMSKGENDNFPNRAGNPNASDPKDKKRYQWDHKKNEVAYQ